MSKQRIFRRRPQQAASPEPTPEPKAENVPAPVESVEVAAPPASPDPALDAGALEDLANMSFAEFSAAMDGIGPKPSRKRWSPGDSVSGIVVRIGGSDLFVDLGGKSEATLSREEAPEARVGDTVTAFVLKTGDELRLCKKLSGRHAVQGLEAAVESGIPMDGRVAERNTGGFVVELSGVRAFCPVSQIDHRPLPDLDAYVGQTFAFTVLEIRGKDVVVGRRELAAEDSAKRVAELWTSLKPGLMLDGSVASIQDYGAFIELGGIQGLAHKSELTWDRRAKPSDLLKVGQRLRVQVIQVDKEAGKISLGLKDKLGEPGEDQGSPRSGRILPEGGMGLFAAAFEKANKK
jgi:small subunit ribosomal protein S1